MNQLMPELIQELKTSVKRADEINEILKAKEEEKLALREKIKKVVLEAKTTGEQLHEKVQMVAKLTQKLVKCEEIIKNMEEEQKVTKEKVCSLSNSNKLMRMEKDNLVVRWRLRQRLLGQSGQTG